MKKFLIKLSYTLLPVFLLLFGLVAYVTLYITPRVSGDLGDLAYIPFELGEALDGNEMTELTFETVDSTKDLRNVHADVLTIGDSFCQMGLYGFQNYLKGNGVSVVNCSRKLYDSPIQYAYNVLDQGVVDSANVKILVVEVGERDFALRIENFDTSKTEVPDPPSTGEEKSNKWSLLRARDFVIYKIPGRCPVYTAELDRDFFAYREPRKLYFYCADVTNAMSLGDDVKEKGRDVMALLQKKAEQRGLKMLFLLPVDKYDFYQDHIIDNPYPRKTVCEEVKELFADSLDVLVCKDYLKPMLEQGEIDIFPVDNSHWSYKASRAVGNELSKRVKRWMQGKTNES